MAKRVPRAKRAVQAAKKPTTDKQRREAKLLNELIKHHGYGILPMRRSADRYQFRMNMKTGEGGVQYAVTLVVPQDSALGSAMIKYDKKQQRCATERARRKARSK